MTMKTREIKINKKLSTVPVFHKRVTDTPGGQLTAHALGVVALPIATAWLKASQAVESCLHYGGHFETVLLSFFPSLFILFT